MKKFILITLFSISLLNLQAQIQEFTEDKCVGGTAFASSSYSSIYLASKAFDDVVTTPWVSAGSPAGTNFWIAYNFPAAKKITKVEIHPRAGFASSALINFSVEASSNSTNGQDGTWTTIASNLNIPAVDQWSEFIVTNTASYTWYRLSGAGGSVGGTYYANIGEIQMRESIDPGSTLPQEFSTDKCIDGTAFASSIYSTGYPASYAFDDLITNPWVSAGGTEATVFWIAYSFNTTQKIEKVRIHPRQAFATAVLMNFSIEASNNSTNGQDGTWTTIKSNLTIAPLFQWSEFIFTNSTPYKWYRLSGTGFLLQGSYFVNIAEVEMMERNVTANALCENIYCVGGGVGIGTSNVPADYKLAVNGKVIAENVKVALQSKWPDYVFEKDYAVKSLPEVKEYIAMNGHLPDMPSAEAVKKEGIDVAVMNALLLQKIEELTLYQIELLEKLNEQENKAREQENRIKLLEKLIK